MSQQDTIQKKEIIPEKPSESSDKPIEKTEAEQIIEEQQKEEQKKQEKKEYQMDLALYDEQMKRIQQEVQEDCPLISDIQDIENLSKEFIDNQPFFDKVQAIKTQYPSYRRVRRDGSCFYRSYLFGIFERIILMNDEELRQTFIKTIKESQEYLKQIGFQELVLEDFHQLLLDKLELTSQQELSPDGLISIFCDKQTSDFMVMYIRFLTSGCIQTNSFLYEDYIDSGISVEQYCHTEVEPIDREADQISMMALINYTNIPVKIIYLDGNLTAKEPRTVILPESADPKTVFVTLLYRPGHYDILYGS